MSLAALTETANDYGNLFFPANANPDLEVKVVHSFHECHGDDILVTCWCLCILLLDQLRASIVLIHNQHLDEKAD